LTPEALLTKPISRQWIEHLLNIIRLCEAESCCDHILDFLGKIVPVQLLMPGISTGSFELASVFLDLVHGTLRQTETGVLLQCGRLGVFVMESDLV
jgi:hypothetical protein